MDAEDSCTNSYQEHNLTNIIIGSRLMSVPKNLGQVCQEPR